ncbi:MAG: HIT family protein [Chloroflexota bacterium]|nr:HIT family protein [Chloroflexota bacterium]
MTTRPHTPPAQCPLCSDLRYIVERSASWTLALNLQQNLPGRCVLVLNRHLESVRELEVEEWRELHRQLARATTAIDALFDPDQYNYAFLMNQDAHVHLHIVPRYSTARKWHGQTFTDPHFGGLFGREEKQLIPDAMEALEASLRQALA